MGAYMYCRNPKCDRGYDKPTAREDLLEARVCDRCGTKQEQRMSEGEWIVELEESLHDLDQQMKTARELTDERATALTERLDELEQQVKTLEEKLWTQEK